MSNPNYPATPTTLLRNRWVQLLAGIVAMVAVANFQYGWTLFVEPIWARFRPLYPSLAADELRTAIQIAFTLFILTETWLVPVEGYLADRYGPGLMVLAGGLIVGVAWAVNSVADSLALLYTGQILAGIGAGIVYGISIGSALKWFPDRRGLAAGLTSAAFGAGAALTVLPIHNMIRSEGYESAFLWFGLGQGAVVILAALVLRAPRPGEVHQTASRKVAQSQRDFTPGDMMRTPAFWLLYAMFTMVATGGLLLVAHRGKMVEDYHLTNQPVSLLGLTMMALPFAMTLERLLNGVTRPFFGWVSDHIGRERTMFIAFALEGFAILAFINLAGDPIAFVLLSGLAFFAWGEIFSLFPAVCADLFGRQYATTNYALLYTAKGTASLLVPLGSVLYSVTGSWVPVFAVVIAFDWITAILALFVLPLLRPPVEPLVPPDYADLAPSPSLPPSHPGSSQSPDSIRKLGQ
ncbi:MAG: oxalate/formate MFS antiporter [Gemmataceae bacterium]|nr:oxalate/formate MFS antiporter [Gemmataceae bacterium]